MGPIDDGGERPLLDRLRFHHKVEFSPREGDYSTHVTTRVLGDRGAHQLRIFTDSSLDLVHPALGARHFAAVLRDQVRAAGGDWQKVRRARLIDVRDLATVAEMKALLPARFLEMGSARQADELRAAFVETRAFKNLEEILASHGLGIAKEDVKAITHDEPGIAHNILHRVELAGVWARTNQVRLGELKNVGISPTERLIDGFGFELPIRPLDAAR